MINNLSVHPFFLQLVSFKAAMNNNTTENKATKGSHYNVCTNVIAVLLHHTTIEVVVIIAEADALTGDKKEHEDDGPSACVSSSIDA